MGSAATCSDAMGLAAADLATADAAGGPSMQIIMQFLLQFVKGFLMDGGWSQIPSTELNNQPFGIPRRADLHLCYGQCDPKRQCHAFPIEEHMRAIDNEKRHANIAQATVSLKYCVVRGIWCNGADGEHYAISGIPVEGRSSD